MMKRYILIISLIVFYFEVSAQKNESKIINKYTTEQGLSSNVIYQILQDRYGFIWIGTEEGLNKFDGKNFTIFSMENGRYSLSHNRTQALMQAPDGNIWAGTSDGLNIYDYDSDSIIKVRTNTSPLKLIYNDITFLTKSNDGKIVWIGTYGNGVNFFDWKKQTFYKLKLPKIPHVSEPTDVMSILEDNNRRLWIGTQHAGLYRYDRVHHEFIHFPLPQQASFVRSIYQDSFRRIWIGTTKGCYIYNETSNRLEPVNYPSGLNNTSIGTIQEDRDGKIWLGSEEFIMNFPVRLFSLTERFPYQIINQGESTSKLNCSSINAIFSDRDNNIWIGTAWGGVNMLQGTPPKFKLYRHEAGDAKTLPNTPITSICTDRNNTLLIASDVMGLHKMNVLNGELTPYKPLKNTTGNIYQAMKYDSEGNLWLGTYNKGLIRIKKNGGVTTYFYDTDNINSLPNNDIRCLFESRDKTLWIGTSNGFAKYDKATNKFWRVSVSRNHLAVRCIKEAENGTLFIGTYGDGVLMYDVKSGKLKDGPVSFHSRVISDILINKDSVWFATMGDGLMLYLSSTKKTGPVFSETNGMSCNYIRSLLRDKSGKIWMGTSKGISKLNPVTGEIENYNTQDGLQSREFQERCVTYLPNGHIAFGGYGGLNIFDPQDVTKNDHCPRVIFTKLLVFNNRVTPGDRKSPLTENITTAGKMVLRHNQSVFTIEFMGINYNATQKIKYAYFLEGSDKRWNYVGNQNSVTFRNLPHGTYIFRVKASSPDAVWNKDIISSIVIVIKPPFWQTWWAYLLYFLVLSGILYFVWQYLTIRVRTANYLKIERAKREKEEELLQEKLQFFTNISHEFRTPLTLLMGPLEKMHQEETDDKKKKHLRLMIRNAKRLLLMVNQLLDFRKADRGQMHLHVQNADIVYFIREVMQSFEELKVQKKIQFDFEHHEEKLMAYFDPEFIDKSLFNLLSNAFKFTPNYGTITVSLQEQKSHSGNKYVEISVMDNGKGIREDEIQHIFQRFYQGKERSDIQRGSGIGLHLTKNLIELHHGSVSVESTPNVRTVFTIRIPSEQKSYTKEETSGEKSIDLIHPDHLSLIESDADGMNRVKESGDRTAEKKTILLVDDNVEIRNYIIDILGEEYNLEEAENGLVGLEMVNSKEYDLIISDLMMPEMDGLEMCKHLKSNIETSHIPIILLTAKSSIESRIEGLNTGADSYISKPFHPDHLSVRVAKLIELRELLKKRYSRKILLGDFQNSEQKTESPDEKFLQEVIRIVLKKMMDSEFNGDVLAGELNISRMGLYRKIKAMTDQSTGEFIRNIRLKKACELLSVQGKNVSEVCYEVGFNSPSYFTTCFTETYKITPSEYVRNVKK